MHKHTFVLVQSCVQAAPCYGIKEEGCIE